MIGYRRAAGDGEHQAVRILELKALPPEISPRLTFNLLSDCLYRNVILECSMIADAGSVRILVLLRVSGRNRSHTDQMADDAYAQMRMQFEDAGFLVEAPNEELMEQLLPCRYESGALFYGTEPVGRYYAPADPDKYLPIDWAAISGVLCRAERACFTVQFIPTALSDAERRIIQENLRFFDRMQGQFQDSSLLAGTKIYESLKQSMDERMFFATVAVFGDAWTRRETAAIMNRSTFHELVLTEELLDEYRRLSPLPYQLADELAEQGHTRAGELMPVMRRFSHLMKKEQAAAFASFPQCSSRLLGVKLNSTPRLNQPLPEAMRDPEGILVGHTVGSRQAINLPFDWLPLHMMLVGMPGMGKTTCAMGILEQIHKAGYPFLIIEPTKTEYRSLIGCVPEMRIYTAGRSDLLPLMLNPFLPPRGITLEQYKPSLVSIFMAAFSMTSPLDVIFPDVVNEAYTRYGWRNSSTRDSKGVRHFGMQEFICVFRECVQRSNYDHDSKMNLESGGTYRLQALLNANPVLFDTDCSLDYDELLEHPTLIELDAIDNSEQKALIMSIVLTNLVLAIRHRQTCDGKFKNAIMIDEAHLLLGQQLGAANEESAKAGKSAVQLLQNLVAAIRAYGTGLIFADQSPRKMTEEIVGNCNFKILFHLENMEDRRMLAHAMGLTERMVEDVRQMDRGEAYVGCSRLAVPLRIHTPDFKRQLKLGDLVGDDEVCVHSRKERKEMLPFYSCQQAGCCVGGCDYACREEAAFLARTICIRTADAQSDETGLREIVDNRRDLVRSAILSLSEKQFDEKRLEACAELQLLRRLRLTGGSSATWIEELYSR